MELTPTNRISVKFEGNCGTYNPEPKCDISALPQETQDEMTALWTPEVIEKYYEMKTARDARRALRYPELPPPTNEDIYNQATQNNTFIKALAKTTAQLTGKTNAEMKALIKANM